MVSQLGQQPLLWSLSWLGRSWSGWAALVRWEQLVSAWRDTGLILCSIVLLATLVAGLLPKAWVLNRPESSAASPGAVARGGDALSGAPAQSAGGPGWPADADGWAAPQWDVLVPALSAGELETLVESGRVTGLFPDERNILEGVFALRDTQVREVMVPRSGMVTLPATFALPK